MATPPAIPRSTPPPIPRRGVSSSSNKEQSRANFRAKRNQDIQQQSQKREAEVPQEKKISGFGFWIIVVLALIKDFIDIALTLTGIGAFLVWMLTGLISVIVGAYFWTKGVKWGAKKVGTAIGTFALELVPFLSAFPIFTAGVIAIRIMSNNEALTSAVKVAHGQFTKSGK